MKLNLLYGTNDIFSGHLNIEHVADAVTDKKILGDLKNLDDFVENAECTSLIAADIIDFFPANEVDSLIQHWIAKLRHGANIVIGGTDLNEMASAIENKRINLIDANILLFGEQREPWEFRKSSLNGFDLVKNLKSVGLKILKHRINNYKYIVEAERP